jgi:hypothetical protein
MDETNKLLTFKLERFAVALASGKANVFITPHILEVFGVTVRKPKGCVIRLL